MSHAAASPTVGLFVRMQAKPGKEAELEAFLKSGLAIAQQEPLTLAWYSVKLGGGAFAIFDVFAAEEGRQAHLTGELAKLLFGKVDELMTGKPTVETLDVIAASMRAA